MNSKVKLNHTLWMFGAVSLLGCTASSAQAPSGEPPAEIVAVFKVCDADMKLLCKGKQGPEAMMCLLAAKEQVSAACKDALSKLPPPPQGGPPTGAPPPGSSPPKDAKSASPGS